ncbi:MAG TPA: pectate lyase [Sphingomonas sp.]|nr:pectate lyase [Sphingomonas sp.]
MKTMRAAAHLLKPSLVLIALSVATATPAGAASTPSKSEIIATMKRATTFMVEKVSTHGGYVWSYLPDMSRRWGELEATPDMIWVQPPGTADMGNLFLDAYHATDDDYYYQAAKKAADALIAGEIPTGGWNYFIDFGGPEATRHFYDTVGKNAWRLEEFQHYWGNATFDDNGTAETMKFILRLYAEKYDPTYGAEVRRNVDFILDSQYPSGGWPQRWPLKHEFVHHGLADYTSYITFNDNVTAENVDYLIMANQILQDQRLLPAIHRGMDVYLLTQQGQPQPGWALQYTPDDLKPAAARSYEPKALATHTTASAIEQLMHFYRLTGDSRYLARIPAALDWLDSVRLPDNLVQDGKAYPTFVEIGTNKPLWLHRTGSNVTNGHYYADYTPGNLVGHYGSTRKIDVAALRHDYEALKAMAMAEVTKDSPLQPGPAHHLPRYYLTKITGTSDLNLDDGDKSPAKLIHALNAQGWWPTPLKSTSNPYTGPSPEAVTPGNFGSTHVGDATDTSPYETDHPVTGISTGTYIDNMETLIAALRPQP